MVDCSCGQEGARPDDKKPADWLEVTVNPDYVSPRSRTEAYRMLSQGTMTDQTTFDNYWKGYFAQLTHWSNRDSLGDLRIKGFKLLLRNKNNAVQRHLVRELALPILTKIAQTSRFSPLVRYNAVLMLGDLNEVEPDSTGRGSKSLPAALPILAEFLDTKKYPINDTNDALRVAALVGIEGHLERGGLSEDQIKLVRPALEALARQEQPPQGRDPEVHGFMQARAQGVVSALDRGVAGRRPAVR
ncbi:MAG: HEAT repeat domain-containing protein [Pirellulales bacterium]